MQTPESYPFGVASAAISLPASRLPDTANELLAAPKEQLCLKKDGIHYDNAVPSLIISSNSAKR